MLGDVLVFVIVVLMFALVLCPIWLPPVRKRSAEREQAALVQRVLTGYPPFPMQDTRPCMYNRHGVHKHNPMLDK
jgi:hypothetical protein